VGVTDIAQTLSLSRQYMRKLMLNNKGSFPAPIHEGKASLWHLSTVLAWLKKENRYSISGTLLDIAEANMQLNFYKEASSFSLPIQDQLARISKENLTSCSVSENQLTSPNMLK
jgi:predicted DNA-binding transcriptional regulator AlpA